MANQVIVTVRGTKEESDLLNQRAHRMRTSKNQMCRWCMGIDTVGAFIPIGIINNLITVVDEEEGYKPDEKERYLRGVKELQQLLKEFNGDPNEEKSQYGP